MARGQFIRGPMILESFMGVKERKMKSWGGDLVKMTSTLVIELSLKIMRKS